MTFVIRQMPQLQTVLCLIFFTVHKDAGTQASSSGCPTPELGMARDIIPNSDITASSENNSDSSPYYARLSNSKAWLPDPNDNDPWIKVNLQFSRNITAITTQGFSGSYVNGYYVSYSSDGNKWKNYTEQGKVKVFQANVDDTTTKRVHFQPSLIAQYIRLHPTNCSNACALRFELYGCNLTTGLPGQPSSLSTKSVSSTKIVISWSAPTDEGDGITGYSVKWQVAGESKIYQKEVTGNRSVTLDKLTPYTWYDIHVRAESQNGDGPWSVPLEVRTKESTPTAAPGNFKVSSSSSLSLDISWDAIPKKEQNGELLGYYIYYKVNGSAVEYNKTVEPQELSDKLTELEFTTYVVRMAGYTVAGVGLSTKAVSIQPNEGAPTAPRNFKLSVESSTEIKASWSAPLKLNGVFKRYVVRYGLSKDRMNTQVYPTNTEYLLTRLDEFSIYYVQVHAETAVSGSASSILSEKTKEDAPSSAPVINKQETKTEDAHTIRVKWNEIKKEDQNGLILGYEVSYKETGTEKVLSFNATNTNTIITRLKPFTSYCIQVRGFTSVGKSPLSPCSDVQTLDKGPSHPLNVKVQAVSSVSIIVTWEEPAHPNGVIGEYIILYGTSKDVQSYEQKVTGSTRKRIIDGLNKYTTYYVKVRGLTSEPGNASEVFNVTTFEDSPGPPKEFRAQAVIATDVHLTWKEPDNSNGIVRFYYIKIYNTKTGLQVGNVRNQSTDEESDMQQHRRLIRGLKYYTDYTFTIQAVTIKPGEMANATARTEEGVPSQPRYVTVKLDKGEISVTWKDPQHYNGIITKYSVYFEGKRAYNTSFRHNHEIFLDKTSRSTEIRVENLKPGTKYSVYLKAKTAKGYGTASDPVELDTPSKRPPAPKLPQVVEADVTTTTITISLSPSDDTNGEIIRHEIIVELLGTARACRETSALPEYIYGFKEAQTNGDRFYIAAMFERRKLPVEFVLGNGKTYGGYENAPLKPGTRYKVHIRGVTERNGKWLVGEAAAISLPETVVTKVDDLTKDNLYLAIVILAALLFIVMIILAVVLILLRKNQQEIASRNKAVKMNQRDFQEGLPLNVLNVGARLESASGNGTGNERLHSESLVQQEDVYTELLPESMMTSENDGFRTYASLVKSTEGSDIEYVNQIPDPDYVNAC